jgi:hypothetical protein
MDAVLKDARTHRPKLVTPESILRKVHGNGSMGRANAWLAVRITRTVGSMWCAYAFAALAFVSLPSALRSGSLVVIVSWISQTFLQLVLLSVIMVGQNVLAASGDERAEADHETLGAIHTLTVGIQKIDEDNAEILRRIDAMR